MNLLFYLIILLATGFVAGIFRYHALIILFIAEILLAVFMLLQLLLSSITLKVKLQGEGWVVDKGKTGQGIISVKKGFLFPINNFGLKGFTAYKDGRQRNAFSLEDGLDEKTTNISFPISGDYAGLKTFSLSRMSLSDILSLFFFSRRLNKKTTISVLPLRRAMNVEFSNATMALIESNRQLNEPTQSRDEFRQVREYAYGDAWRDVDWHKSAKADKLMVREYEREAEAFVDLELDGRGYHSAGTEVLDGYYEILSALLRGFIDSGISFRITRLTEGGLHRAQNIIRSEEDVDAFFIDLYSSGIYDPDYSKAEDKSPRATPKDCLRLDLNCRLTLGKKLLYSFNRDNPEEDIESRLIVI